MQTNVLQSMLHRNSTAIFNLECEIRREKAHIAYYKITGTHKDYFDFRYNRLEKMARKLSALVKIQRALKDEVAENVKDVREFLDDPVTKDLVKILNASPCKPVEGTIRPNYEQD